jgi:hypothetical protein
VAEIWTAKSASHELRKTFWLDEGRLCSDTLNPGKRFAYERHEVRSLRDVYHLLQRLADHPHTALVMGRPTIAEGERNTAYFEDNQSDFWLIDLDGVPMHGSAQDTILHCLPFLTGEAYVYAFSQSAGLREALRCRVVCRVPRPLGATELEAYARHYNDLLAAFEGRKKQYIDPSIYSPSRLLFTARPKLSDLGDPHPERVFYVKGNEEPVALGALPDMVEITDQGGQLTFSELPRLPGGWGYQEREGHNRSINALKGIGWLRAYMGADWEDVAKRQAFLHEMLDRAGASEVEKGKYGDF